MRIISGTAGGIALQVPKGEVRPTTDRVREALFSILGERIQKAQVLDLFSGSGALGLESLSRGAAYATMVDAAKSSCSTIHKNMDKAALPNGIVHCADAISWVKREAPIGRKYDIIFADPPYCKGLGDRDFIVELARNRVAELLADGGIFIAEAQEGWGIAGIAKGEPVVLPHLTCLDIRRYGNNVIMIFEKTQKEEVSN
ncbi:MAG: RsmD family RNA methyltransferase [Akkermansia sp.]